MGIFCRNYDSNWAALFDELSIIRKQNALILSNQATLLASEQKMSQQLDTIKAALTDLATNVQADFDAIDALLAKIPTAADDAEVADIVSQAQALSAAAKAKAAAAVPPATA